LLPAALAATLVVLALAGCSGPQSTLAPGGRGAQRIATLFWSMSAGAVLIWAVSVGLAVYAIFRTTGPHSRRAARRLIVLGGAVLPTALLAGVLVYGLALLPPLMAPAPDGSLRIFVLGEQWWWRIRYLAADGKTVDLANEIRLPVGEPVEFQLESHDVIHSFWIPALGGKVDMIPGRRTRLTLEPTRTGVFRGACAEYCGTSHALMNLWVVVLEPEEFARWLARQLEPARPDAQGQAARGAERFLANGCGACHALRGTPADGFVGPDLTHVGSRLSIGAGLLPRTTENLARWLSDPQRVKPGVHMPAFGMLPGDERRAIAVYLDGLK
jgi:cytochrome c oxidase subunit 2